MTTKITAQMSLLLTKKHLRREQNGERLGAISKHSLEHYLVKKMTFFLNSLCLEQENFVE